MDILVKIGRNVLNLKSTLLSQCKRTSNQTQCSKNMFVQQEPQQGKLWLLSNMSIK